MVETNSTDDYFGGMPENRLHSTASRLDYLFGLYVGSARNLHNGIELNRDMNYFKINFIEGLQAVIELQTTEQRLPEYGNVTYTGLREMLELAQNGNWSELDAIKDFYRYHSQLNGTEYKGQILFPSK